MEEHTTFSDVQPSTDDMVLFAVPKKGRMHQDCMKLLGGAGINAKRPERLDVAMCEDLPIKLIFLPASDIPAYVLEGDVDMGISGSDVLEEMLVGERLEEVRPVQIVTRLGFGKCRLCVQAPIALNCTESKMFSGKRIVTSFPNLARKHFAEHDKELGTSTTIRVVSGSVEAACGLGLADAIVDIVETGTTMHAAGLEVVTTIFSSEALLFQRKLPHSRSHTAEQTDENSEPPAAARFEKKVELMELIKKRIEGYMTATRHMMLIYNCHDDHLAQCCLITPGKQSPTVTELKSSGWHSVSSLVEKASVHKVMDDLGLAGATDILCFSLTNTRM